MRKHGGTPSRRDKHVTLAAISRPGVARGRFVGGQQSGLAGSKPPPLFTREASSCSSQRRRQGEPWGASPRPSAPTYLPGTNLRHIRDRELSRLNGLRQPASFKVGDLVLVHHSRLPSWPRNCLQDPYFGPYGIIRIDGSRIHVRCSPRLGGELLCAPKQFRHYHSPDDLSWDEWSPSDSEVERIDLENAASPEEADELEEMTADEMAVDG